MQLVKFAFPDLTENDLKRHPSIETVPVEETTPLSRISLIVSRRDRLLVKPLSIGIILFDILATIWYH